jgi:hypothetical protein
MNLENYANVLVYVWNRPCNFRFLDLWNCFGTTSSIDNKRQLRSLAFLVVQLDIGGLRPQLNLFVLESILPLSTPNLIQGQVLSGMSFRRRQGGSRNLIQYPGSIFLFRKVLLNQPPT